MDAPVPKCQLNNLWVTCHAVGFDFFCPPVSTPWKKKTTLKFGRVAGEKVVQGLNNLSIYVPDRRLPVRCKHFMQNKNPFHCIIMKKCKVVNPCEFTHNIEKALEKAIEQALKRRWENRQNCIRSKTPFKNTIISHARPKATGKTQHVLQLVHW